MSQPFDAILVVSFGGPEGPDEVLPFLENVLRGRNVPRERMLAVAEHYQHFGGVSPINAQNRKLVAALRGALDAAGISLPIYWGNRNWHPLLPDTTAQMQAAGVRRALALVTSSFGSYSGCRQYLQNIEQARAEVGSAAPAIEKLRLFYNHPGFIEAQAARIEDSLKGLSAERRAEAQLVFTAHSIPQSQAAVSPYEQQLREACRLVASAIGHDRWQLAYQSRSGPPTQPWLEPDVCDLLREIAARADGAQGGSRDVIVVPIGFLSDHMEVIYDLDVEARAVAEETGLNLIRASTVGDHPQMIQTIVQLIQERISDAPRKSLGACGPWPDVCPQGCCLSEQVRTTH